MAWNNNQAGLKQSINKIPYLVLQYSPCVNIVCQSCANKLCEQTSCEDTGPPLSSTCTKHTLHFAFHTFTFTNKITFFPPEARYFKNPSQVYSKKTKFAVKSLFPLYISGPLFFFKVTHSKSLFLALQIKSRHVLKDHNSRFTLASVISDDISATDDELAWAPESPTKSNAMRCSVARCIQS